MSKPAAHRTPVATVPAHEAVPVEGDYFHLQSLCAVCSQLIYWRLGAGIWDHPEKNAQVTR